MQASSPSAPLGSTAHKPSRRQRRANYGIRVHRYEVKVPGLDAAHDGLRIAHLTDIHVGMLTPRKLIRRAVEVARAAHPDLTVLTGDFVCYGPNFVQPMGEILAGLSGEVTCVLGNHDYWTDAEGVRGALERQGYSVLRNQHRELRIKGAPLNVVGIDDAITRHHDVPRAFRGVAEKRTTIALSHAPNCADAAVAHGAQLVFAGHTHGGHVRIPRVTERIMAQLGNRYLAGFYPIHSDRHSNPGLLYVNCGLGTSSVPFRAGAPPEVAILELKRA